MSSNPANEAIVRAFYRAFEEDDLERGLELLSEDVEWHFQGPEDIPYAGTFRGRDGVREFMEMIGQYVTAEEFVVDEVFSVGDRVIALGHERMLVKKTGKTFSMGWADIYTIRDGRIVRFTEYTDTGAMLKAYQGE